MEMETKNRNNSLKSNAFLNVIKQGCVIVLPIIIFPYVSRVLGAENYGKINFSNSFVNYISMIATLGITNYAVREGSMVRNDKLLLDDTINQIYTINMGAMIFSYIILGILLLTWRKLDGYFVLILVQSSVVLFNSIGADWINMIFEDYLFITVRYSVCQLIVIALVFLVVKNSHDYIIYAILMVSSSVLANIFNIVHIRKKLNVHPKLFLNKDTLKHFKSIFIIFFTSVASTIYINSDITILGVLKDDTAVGYYSVAAKIYGLTKQILNAFMIVGIPRFSNQIANGKTKEVNKSLNEILNILLVCVGPVMIGLVVLSEDIIYLFSGTAYLPAAKPLKILAVSLFFATNACFYVNVVMLPNRYENRILIATVISAVSNIILNLVLIPSFGISAAAMTTLVSEIIMVLLGIFYTRNIVDFKIRKAFLIGLLTTIITFIVCISIRYFEFESIITVFLSIIFSIFAFTFVLLVFHYGTIKKILYKCRKRSK